MASFYESEKNVNWYEEACKDYDAKPHVERFQSYVPAQSKVLELGIGPGKDHDLLRESYQAVGSDYSPIFIKRYQDKHPDSDIRVLDAVTIDSNTIADVIPFDAVFTNKVLQHLKKSDFVLSLTRQAQIVKPGGVLFHTLWYGEDELFHENLRFQNYTEQSIRDAVPESLKIEAMQRYTELEENDSIVVVLRVVDSNSS